MPKCQKCNKEIDHLIVKEESVVLSYFSIENNEPFFEEKDKIPMDFLGFFCPECDALLFTTQDEAEEFLKSGLYDSDDL